MTTRTEKSRKTIVPERLRRDSSTTALKAAAETRGFSYPHKGSSVGTHGQRWEAWKTAGSCGKLEAMHNTHDQRREAWKTAESCGVMESGYLKYRYGQLSLIRVWVTIGTGPQCCKSKTFRLLIKECNFAL